MGISANDLLTKAMTIANEGDNVVAGPCRVRGWVVTAAAGAAQVDLYDAADTAGSAAIILKAATGTTIAHFLPAGGTRFATALTVDHSNSAATPDTVAVFYTEDPD